MWLNSRIALSNDPVSNNECYSFSDRCVSGSTLLHTASFFGAIPVIKVYLMIVIPPKVY